MPIDPQKLLDWPFAAVLRHYDSSETIRVAKGFGAGIPGELVTHDAAFIAGQQAYPMMALHLADGAFWQSDPESGIDWRRIVHAEETLHLHGELRPQGTVVVTQRVDGLYDRGPERGAVMVQKQYLHSENGELIATIDTTTFLRGDGGYGGPAYMPDAKISIPDDRPPDAVVTLRTPADNDDAIYRLSPDLAVAAHLPPGQSMMRGIGCFGLAGRAVMAMVCPHMTAKLKRLSVRYTGAMLSDEVMRLDLWKVAKDRAVFRLTAVERDVVVLDYAHCVF